MHHEQLQFLINHSRTLYISQNNIANSFYLFTKMLLFSYLILNGNLNFKIFKNTIFVCAVCISTKILEIQTLLVLYLDILVLLLMIKTLINFNWSFYITFRFLNHLIILHLKRQRKNMITRFIIKNALNKQRWIWSQFCMDRMLRFCETNFSDI